MGTKICTDQRRERTFDKVTSLPRSKTTTTTTFFSSIRRLLAEKEDQRQTGLIPPLSDLCEENGQLKRRIEELEDVIGQLEKESDTIGRERKKERKSVRRLFSR